ncbi:MAG: hypothetical protein ABSF62_10490 [Bryobacteraceae bacterium]
MINNRLHVECREIGLKSPDFSEQLCHGDTCTSRADIESAPVQHFVDNGTPLYLGKVLTVTQRKCCYLPVLPEARLLSKPMTIEQIES